MANLFPTIVPGKVLKDNTHKIRIALSHNEETRYIVTDIIVSSPKAFKNGIIIKREDASYEQDGRMEKFNRGQIAVN